MLIEKDNSPIFINNRSNKLASNPPKVNLLKPDTLNQDMLFLSFKGSLHNSKQYTQDDIDEVEKLLYASLKSGTDADTTTYYNKLIPVLEKNIFYPEENLELAKRNDKINTSMPQDKETQIALLQLQAINELSYKINHIINKDLNIKLDVDYYFPIIEQLITQSPKDKFWSDPLLSVSLKFLAKSYSFLNDTNKQKALWLAQNILESQYDKSCMIPANKIVKLAEAFKDPEIQKLYAIKKKINQSEIKSKEDYKNLYLQEIAISRQELNEPAKYLQRAAALDKFDDFHNFDDSNNYATIPNLISVALRTISNQFAKAKESNISLKLDYFNKASGYLTDTYVKQLREQNLLCGEVPASLADLLLKSYANLSTDNRKKVLDTIADISKNLDTQNARKIVSIVAEEFKNSKDPCLKQFLEINFKKPMEDVINAGLEILETDLLGTDKKTIDRNDIKYLTDTIDMLAIVLYNFQNSDIKLDIDSEKCFNLLSKVLKDSTKFPNSQDLYNTVKNFLMLVYNHFDAETQKKTELFFITDEIFKNDYLINFFYYYDKNQDQELKKLVELITTTNSFEDLKSSDYLKAREELFQQEFKILYQELTEPEKHLLRAGKMGVIHSLSDDPENLLQLQLRALRGISSVLAVNKELKLKLEPVVYDNLAIAFISLLEKEENSPSAKSLKSLAIYPLADIYNSISPENKEKVEKIALNLIKNSNPMEIKTKVIDLFVHKIDKSSEASRQFVDLYTRKLNDTDATEQEKIASLITLAQFEYYHTLNLIIDIVSDVNTVKNEKIATLMDSIKFESPDSRKLINNILTNNSIIKEKKVKALLDLTKFESLSTGKFIENILSKDNSSHSLKMMALWAAGLDHTDKNFNLLLNIINHNQPVNRTNTTDEELELKEMALYSLAEFGNKDVKSLLEKVADSKPDLKELALALIEKINSKYDNECLIKDYLNTEPEQQTYKKLRDEYVPNFEKLSSANKYWIDKAILPFRTVLKELITRQSKLTIIDDTVTAVNKTSRGIRNPYGFFKDIAGGQAQHDGNIVIPKYQFYVPSTSEFTFGHEWGHQILHHIRKHNPIFNAKLDAIYKLALKENTCLRSYGANSIDDYFADGNEAYLSIYKPHYGLIYSNDSETGCFYTRYSLKKKDPRLYNLIEEVYKYYNQQNLIKPINLVA